MMRVAERGFVMEERRLEEDPVTGRLRYVFEAVSEDYKEHFLFEVPVDGAGLTVYDVLRGLEGALHRRRRLLRTGTLRSPRVVMKSAAEPAGPLPSNLYAGEDAG